MPARPIKFRALDGFGAWQFYDLGILLQGHKAKILEDTVGQFTGLTDKNGKEIYEGDLLEYKNSNKPKKAQPIHEVIWVSDKARFRFKRHFKDGNNDESGFSNGSWEASKSRFEIIGNIHSNPELLEGK